MTRVMKDSGIEWIGEIPEELELTSINHIVRYVKGRNPNNINNEKIGKPYVGASDLLRKDKDYDNYTEEKLVEIKEEDVLILWDGARAGLVGTGHTGVLGSTIVKLNNDEKLITNRYLYWHLKAFEFLLLDWVGGTTIPHMNRKFIKRIPILNNSIKNQIMIADFLDKKVSEIDNIISKTEKVIEEYKSYKQSLITETVTKGLDRDVAMKDSGIEWIGEIPEHWETVRGKNILEILDRKILESDDVITCFRDGEVTLRKNRREEGFTVSLKEIGYQGIDPGDLVVHGMDGFAGAIGISDSRGKGSPVLNVLDTDEDKGFIKYYLRMLADRNVFLALSTGIRERSTDLRWNKISDLDFILPNLKEQKQISSYLDKKCGDIDNIIKTKEKLLVEMENYKKSLIYETVTGKREVE